MNGMVVEHWSVTQ